MGWTRMTAAVALAAGIACGPAAAQTAKVSRPGVYSGYAAASYDGHERTSFYVPMRDGTRLAVDLFRPTRKGVVATEKLPVVWMHTPYNRRTYNNGPTAERYPGFALKLVPYGYNVAVVDFRGLYASFGTNGAYNRGEWLDAAHLDAFDTTEWFAKQPWSNGKIGMWGCSATGGSQMQAATTRPPSLKAIFPMSAEFDAYAFAVPGGISSGRPAGAPDTVGVANPNAARDARAVAVDGPDGARLLAEAIAGHKDNIESAGVLPYRDSLSPALKEKWWMKSSPAPHLAALKRPGLGVYAVANWDEATTRHGAFFTFRNLGERQAKLLVGPATHCAWSAVQQETGFDLVVEELRFFDHWLKGVPNGVMDEPAVTYFTYNAPDGQRWRTAKAWPLPQERRTAFLLREKGLATTAGAAGEDATPTTAPPRAISTTVDPPTGGLIYETEPLKADTEVTGHPEMRLWVSTDAGDVDVMARLEDVGPDGKAASYQMIGRLRASHGAPAKAPFDHMGLPWRTSNAADARPLPAGAPTELAFDLLPMSYIFKAGHRIRLNLSFADPQGRTAPAPTIRVHRSSSQPSRLILPVIPAG